MVIARIPFNCQPLDDILGGGVENGAVTLLYGEGGTGKSNLCMVLARNVALGGKKVAFIDTEGLSLERFEHICGGEFPRVLQGMLVFKPYTLHEQELAVESCVRLAEGSSEVGLLVLDSATVYYRMSFGSDAEDESRLSLANQVTALLTASRKLELPVLVTTQVYTDVKRGGSFEPIGGHLFTHNAKAILKLERMEGGLRRATVVKHRSIPSGRGAVFALTAAGIGPPAREGSATG